MRMIEYLEACVEQILTDSCAPENDPHGDLFAACVQWSNADLIGTERDEAEPPHDAMCTWWDGFSCDCPADR